MASKRSHAAFWSLLLLVMIIPAGLWAALGRPGFADPPMRIRVSLGARQLNIVENGDVVASYGIAIGRPDHPTPTGTFRTGAIIWNPAWNPPPVDWARDKERQEPGSPSNPMQAVKIYFNAPYYFIHGTNDPGSIGEAASHGCIRMNPDDATNLAHRIQQAGGSVPMVIEE